MPKGRVLTRDQVVMKLNNKIKEDGKFGKQYDLDEESITADCKS